ADYCRHRARQLWLLHLERCQRDACRKSGHSEQPPYEEVASAYEPCQPTEVRTARAPAACPPTVCPPTVCPPTACALHACPPAARRRHDLAIPPQHRHQRRQHHRYHHYDPHAHEGRRGARPRLSWHPHPHHRHRSTAGHGHVTH